MLREFKRAIAVFMIFAGIITYIPVNAFADTSDNISQLHEEDLSVDSDALLLNDTNEDVTIIDQDRDFADHKDEALSTISMGDDGKDCDENALLDGYLNQLIDSKKIRHRDEINADKVDRRESLNKANLFIYDFLAGKITRVAKGEISSTVFETGEINVFLYSDKVSFTKDELGVSDFNSEEAMRQALSLAGFDIDKVFSSRHVLPSFTCNVVVTLPSFLAVRIPFVLTDARFLSTLSKILYLVLPDTELNTPDISTSYD